MKNTYYGFGLGLISSSLAMPCFAGLTFGDATTNTGALTVSGYVRANYQDKNYGSDNDHKLQFNAAKLALDYEAPKWFAHTEYRCYQYNTLCDFSTLVDAYAGYRFNAQQNLTVGVQPIPFGISRFWESSLYGGINNTMGLEDAHNLGVNYHHEIDSTKIDLAYFATDAGNYTGDSRDSARYTANFVNTVDASQSSLNEKNMWIGRISQGVNFSSMPLLNMTLGGSYWYSDIENKTTGLDGSRKAWALFGSLAYQNFALTLTGGNNSVDNQDELQPNSSVMGSYDGEYNVANEGDFYTADVRYSFKDVYHGLDITPYATYSTYVKDQAGYKDSTRNFLGVSFDYKKTSLVAEYIMSKNDPFISGSQAALAEGDADGKWNKLLNLTFFYYF